jgi:hypothetical protein
MPIRRIPIPKGTIDHTRCAGHLTSRDHPRIHGKACYANAAERTRYLALMRALDKSEATRTKAARARALEPDGKLAGPEGERLSPRQLASAHKRAIARVNKAHDEFRAWEKAHPRPQGYGHRTIVPITRTGPKDTRWKAVSYRDPAALPEGWRYGDSHYEAKDWPDCAMCRTRKRAEDKWTAAKDRFWTTRPDRYPTLTITTRPKGADTIPKPKRHRHRGCLSAERPGAGTFQPWALRDLETTHTYEGEPIVFCHKTGAVVFVRRGAVRRIIARNVKANREYVKAHAQAAA